MRVLQVTKFYPPVRGGIETASYELTEGINRRGVAADVLCGNLRARTSHERAPAGYRIVRAACFGRLLSTSIAPSLIAEARRLVTDYDVVHVHMPDPMAALALRLIKPKCPLVLHWHSDVVRQRLSRRLYRPIEEWLVGRADAIVATSAVYAESSDVLRRHAAKVKVIPIGISDPAEAADPARVATVRARWRGHRLVLGIGRMTYYKGFDVLIDAARLLPDDVRVLIGGDGYMFDRYRRRIDALGLGERVHLLGPLGNDELRAHYAAADVFCLPSTARAEAFGIAMVEAMAMSKPVVSTHIEGSGVPWVNRDGRTGLTVPPGDAHALAQALRRVLDAPSLAARLGAGGRERYLAKFRVDDMAERVIHLYRDVLAH